jgi:hypothetical protein
VRGLGTGDTARTGEAHSAAAYRSGQWVSDVDKRSLGKILNRRSPRGTKEPVGLVIHVQRSSTAAGGQWAMHIAGKGDVEWVGAAAAATWHTG